MKTLEELNHELNKLNRQLTDVLSASKYDEYGDLCALEINRQDPEQLFLLNELGAVLEHLEAAKRKIKYLEQPVTNSEILHKNTRKRYSCKWHEFSSGDGIECLVHDSYAGCLVWVHTRVEHNGSDYYLVGYEKTPMENLIFRFRKNM